MKIYSIYLITNSISGTQYIGFTSKDLLERIKTHKQRCSYGVKNKLYSSVRSYGWENFNFEIIYQSKDGDHCLNVMESKFISEYDTLSNGYNMTSGGEGIIGYWNKDTKKSQSDFIKTCWSEERRKRNGEFAKLNLSGKPKSEEAKKKMCGKRPHVCQSGGKNNNAKPIMTPYGKFDSIMTAFKQLYDKNVIKSYRQVEYRVNSNSENNKNWYIMESN